jgi:hypothetical protein
LHNISETKLFTAFLENTSPDILAISKHGLKEDEITQCTLEGYTVVSNVCRKEQTRCYKEIRNVSEANIIGLCSSIQTETWIEVSREDDVEKKLDSFYSIFNYYFNIACPKVLRKYPG